MPQPLEVVQTWCMQWTASFQEDSELQAAEAKRVVTAMDVDRAGELSQSNFLAAASRRDELCTDATMHKVWHACIDKRGEGLVTRASLAEALSAFKPQPNELNAAMRQLALGRGEDDVRLAGLAAVMRRTASFPRLPVAGSFARPASGLNLAEAQDVVGPSEAQQDSAEPSTAYWLERIFDERWSHTT